MTEVDHLRKALTAMFIDAERTAVDSYTTWTDSLWVFNDKMWREEDADGAEIAIQARELIGLKPFEYSGTESPGFSIRNAPPVLETSEVMK